MLTIEGYAAIFNIPDLSGEIFTNHAFSNIIRRVRMLNAHNPNQEIGTWEIIKPDKKGLFVRGIIQTTKTLNLDGLSVGYKTLKEYRIDGNRVLDLVDLWEISICQFPLHPLARFEQVK